MELISLPQQVYNFTEILLGNQLEGQTFFLTYPETNKNKMEKEPVIAFLRKNLKRLHKTRIKEFVICSENYDRSNEKVENDEKHFHVFIKLNKNISLTKSEQDLLFDYKNESGKTFHGHYRMCLSRSHAIMYCIKEDENVVTNLTNKQINGIIKKIAKEENLPKNKKQFDLVLQVDADLVDKSFEELEKYILNENKKGNFDTIIIDSIQQYMTMGSELDLKGNKQKPDNMNITLINIENIDIENVNAGNTFESEKIYQLEKKVHYLETKITEQQKQFETLVEMINQNKNSPVFPVDYPFLKRKEKT